MELYGHRLPPSLPQHLFFLILTACSASLFPCSFSIDAAYQYCKNNTKCGALEIQYPLGVGNHGCGLPGFQINCMQNSSAVIMLNGQIYTVLGFFNSAYIIVISKGQNCQFLDDSINNEIRPSEFAGSVFTFQTIEILNVYVYKCKKRDQLKPPKCNSTVYYAVYQNKSPSPGCSVRQVKVNAALIQSVHKNTGCASCEASSGVCGYNTSNSTTPAPFVCYCKDGSHTDKCAGHGGHLNKVVIIIGCSFGGVALTVIIGLSYAKRRRTRSPRTSASKVEKFLRGYAAEMPSRFSFSRLKKMTNNFTERLGEGGYGVVYKGKLRNGTLVAVKLLDRQRHSEAQFMNEVATIGHLHHVILVRLLGYCFENFASALVYEYMANGSLDKFILDRKEKGQTLRWAQLYYIAVGAARGIAYLHQDCEKRIIHFDIKPHNILLDADFTPKVSDFGLAKLCGKAEDHVSMTGARGTPGYVAPELCYTDAGPVTDKSDVYSFGMLLLEIVGGRKNLSWEVSRSSQFYFPDWAFKLLESGEVRAKLRGGNIEDEDDESGEVAMIVRGGNIGDEADEKARRLTKIGLWCIQYKSTDRPSMSRIVQMLEGNGNDVPNPPLPSNSSSATPQY